MTHWQADLVRYALENHIRRNGSDTTDKAHNEMIAECDAIIAEINRVFGPAAPLLGAGV